MPTRDTDQLAFDEKVVTDADLERLLEVRSVAKAQAALAAGDVRRADEAAKAVIEKLDIGIDAAIRIGRWRITKQMIAGHAVSFETEAKERITIGLVGE